MRARWKEKCARARAHAWKCMNIRRHVDACARVCNIYKMGAANKSGFWYEWTCTCTINCAVMQKSTGYSIHYHAPADMMPSRVSASAAYDAMMNVRINARCALIDSNHRTMPSIRFWQKNRLQLKRCAVRLKSSATLGGNLTYGVVCISFTW